MQRNSLLFLLILIVPFLLSCEKDTRSDADRSFEELSARFLEQYFARFPENASALGDHRYDGRMNDYSHQGVEDAIVFYHCYLDTLHSLPVETLSAEHMIDYDILQHMIETDLFSLEDLREWEWNPLAYTVGDAMYNLIIGEQAPLDQRMRNLRDRMRAIPAVLEAARENLGNPPAIHTQTAILQNNGSLAMLRSTLQPFIDSLPTALRDSLITERNSAMRALYDYGSWLRGDLMSRSRGDFRLGKEMYHRKFQLYLDTDMPPAQLLTEAERLLERTTNIMYETASVLYPRFYPEEHPPQAREEVIRVVLDHLAEDHATDSSVVAQTEEALRSATEFVHTRQLVTVPPDPLKIIVMPEFQRGVAVAYCDAPGPLETGGETFFAIAPTPLDWTSTRKSSFYREYNNHMLKNLAVHEAMPGHFLQLAVAKHSKAPTLVRRLFPSTVFAEGWATYAEAMMADAGFGGLEMKMQQLKMYLRLLINAIIDHRIHAMGMRESEAIRMMIRQGFQEESEAAGKWRRACLTSVQLSTYFFGNLKIRELRSRYEEREKKNFDLKTFHDELLSHGTISPKYHPMLMRLPARLVRDSIPVVAQQ